MKKKPVRKAKRKSRESAPDISKDALSLVGMALKNRSGRPTKYSKELAERLCRIIATTSKGIKTICAENEDFPTPGTFFVWLADVQEFSDLYAKAKDEQCQVLADDIIEIADTAKMGQVTIATQSGNKKPRIKETRIADMIRHRTLQIDVRKWLLSKLAPKVYGDRIQLADDREDPTLALIEEFRDEKKRIDARLNGNDAAKP
jgi:hypothetical protein